MSTVNPLPPTLPGNPTVPSPVGNPTSPVPGNGFPQTAPTRVPVNVPNVSPGGAGAAAGVIVTLEVLRDLGTCDPGRRVRMNKKFPRNGDEKKRRRQRPCQGGTPQRTKKKVREKIGRFFVAKSSGYGFLGTNAVLLKTIAKGRQAGFRLTEPKNVKIESELSRPKGVWERIVTTLMRGDVCWYQVFAVREVTKCTCPDGSPCRSTTRRD